MSEFKFSLFNRPELINSKNIDSSSKDLSKSSKFKLISKFDVKGLNFILPLKILSLVLTALEKNFRFSSNNSYSKFILEIYVVRYN